MLKKSPLLLCAALLATLPTISYARSNDPAERIGVGIICGILLVVVLGIVNWVKSKNNKEDQNKPL